jgi:dienelactone hydrolase
MASLIRFIRAYASPEGAHVTVQPTTYQRGGETLPGLVFKPATARGRLPGWVVLHGLTRTGSSHPGLQRFARAVAASGSVVLIPDIPEWRELRVAPAVTIDTIRAAVRALQQRDDVRHEHAGMLGFSFGATQALVAATDPDIAGMLHGIASWGGYCDLHAAFAFAMTGEHKLDGKRYQIAPDPYGTWVMAGNYLTRVPGHERDGDVARALHSLAIEAGDRGFYAWEPIFDASKMRLREQLRPANREVFDALAPLTTSPRPAGAFERELADGLADAAIETDPLLDPRPHLGSVRVPTLIAHGRDDRLIPFTQSILLSRLLPPETVKHCVITGLFAHSGGTVAGLRPAARAVETVRFVRLLRALLRHA